MAHRVLAIFRRRLFNFLTILSLLLCLVTVALWVRSYWRFDLVAYVTVDFGFARNLGFASGFGELDIFDYPYYGSHAPGWRLGVGDPGLHATLSSSAKRVPGARTIPFLGLGYVHDLRILWFQHWFPALVFAILPAVRLLLILRTRRRHRAGLCSHCGYDLRATPQGGRCPECGAVAPTSGEV